MNTLILALVASLVDAKVSNQEMFTAYDITLLTRAAGHQVAHSDVRTEVRRKMQGTQGYTSKLRVLGTSQFPAVVYHAHGADPYDYDPDATRTALVTATSVPTPSAPKPQPQAPMRTPGERIRVGSKQRLRIPAQSIRNLGLASGDKAFVSFDSGKITVTATAPVGRDSRSYTVDEYDNLLFKVPFQVSDEFSLVKDGARISLSLV